MNPKNVSAMILRTRKKIEGPKHVVSKNKSNDQIEKELEEEARNETTPKVISNFSIKVNTNPSPFLAGWRR